MRRFFRLIEDNIGIVLHVSVSFLIAMFLAKLTRDDILFVSMGTIAVGLFWELTRAITLGIKPSYLDMLYNLFGIGLAILYIIL